jgi:hypothetical protein
VTEAKYPALKPNALDQELAFSGEGVPDLKVGEFWRWYLSCLTDNTTRGVLAEFLVAKAVGAKAQMRTEWDAYDVEAPDGTKIEVKSSSRWQTWGQAKPSALSFRIAPTLAWDTDSGTFGGVKRRHADVYVFAVLDCDGKADLNPLDLAQWTFYVLATAILDAERPTSESIGVGGLKQLGAVECGYAGLRDAVRKAAASMAPEAAAT